MDDKTAAIFKAHKLKLTHATSFVWSCTCGDGGMVFQREGWDGNRIQDEVDTRAFAHLGQMLGLGDDPYDHHDGCICYPRGEGGEWNPKCRWHGWEFEDVGDETLALWESEGGNV